MKRLLVAAVLALGLAGVAHAAIDTYEFANDADRERYAPPQSHLRTHGKSGHTSRAYSRLARPAR